MNVQPRDLLGLVGIAGLGAVLLAGVHGLRPFGHYDGAYGTILDAVAPVQRQIQNVVTAVNFDYRCFDTLGEEFILFTGVGGVALLLREMHGKEIVDTLPRPDPGSLGKSSIAVRAFAVLMAPLTLFFGAYVVLLAHLSVGGGFQGGVILSSAWMVLYLSGGDRFLHRTARRSVVEVFESVGAGGFAAMGIVSLATGGAFLYNFLPYGSLGHLASAGFVPIINALVGMEVCAGFVLLYSSFMNELAHRIVRPKG